MNGRTNSTISVYRRFRNRWYNEKLFLFCLKEYIYTLHLKEMRSWVEERGEMNGKWQKTTNCTLPPLPYYCLIYKKKIIIKIILKKTGHRPIDYIINDYPPFSDAMQSFKTNHTKNICKPLCLTDSKTITKRHILIWTVCLLLRLVHTTSTDRSCQALNFPDIRKLWIC